MRSVAPWRLGVVLTVAPAKAGFARLRACVVTLNLGGVLALAALLFDPAEEAWAAAYALGGSGVIAWACRDSRFSWLWARAD